MLAVKTCSQRILYSGTINIIYFCKGKNTSDGSGSSHSHTIIGGYIFFEEVPKIHCIVKLLITC